MVVVIAARAKTAVFKGQKLQTPKSKSYSCVVRKSHSCEERGVWRGPSQTPEQLESSSFDMGSGRTTSNCFPSALDKETFLQNN